MSTAKERADHARRALGELDEGLRRWGGLEAIRAGRVDAARRGALHRYAADVIRHGDELEPIERERALTVIRELRRFALERNAREVLAVAETITGRELLEVLDDVVDELVRRGDEDRARRAEASS